MVLNKHSKEKEISIHDTTTYQQQMASLKEATFTAIAAHLQQNCEAPSYPFYLFLLLQHLALLWYLIRPDLNVYRDVYLIEPATKFLRMLNPHELMAGSSDLLYQNLVMVAGLYLLVQLMVAGVSIYATIKGKSGQFFKYLRKIVNYQFLFTTKALSGPLLALVVNVVYCDPKSTYHKGQTCYDAPYVIICALAGAVGLVVLLEVLLLALIYYIRNPLDSSYMGVQNMHYVLSKTIVKIMMPLYFAVDPSLSLYIVYMYAATGLFAAYIFWHRLFSIHSYNQHHFYVEYFLQACLFWVAVSNLIYYYVSNGAVQEEFSFVYTLCSAAGVAVLLLSIEARAEEAFFTECLSGKIKKQNMEKFTFVIIHRLLSCTAAVSKIRFKTFSKLLAKNSGIVLTDKKGKEGEGSQNQTGGTNNRDGYTEVYKFLLHLLQGFLLQNNSTMLRAIRCQLSCLLGQRSYGIHQSLQLLEQRLSLVQELMLFQFRHSINLFENQGLDKENRDYYKFYRFHEEFGRLEVYIQACGKNNADYWEQLCESDPSLAKLRNLATLYSLYETRINEQYTKIAELVPESLHAATLYFSFLGAMGVDVRGQIRMKEKLSSICEARNKSQKISNQDIGEDQEMSIITLDTIGNNLGVVLNSNSYVKQLLGFEKSALLGKNITKIMPKIYTELHSSFMLGFIRSEHSNQTSVKRVTALNKNSLLVDISLSVRILSSTQSDLAIAGFMKRIPADSNVGLVMYSLNNGQVLGIDENFVVMMNRRLSGKQVAQEEVRLTVLMPQLSLQKLQREREQESVLQVGSSLQEEGELQVQKKVLVRLKSFKVYEGVRLGFLEIIDIARYQTANSKLTSSSNSRMPLFVTKEFVQIENGRPSTRKRTQDFSIYLEESMQALNESGDSLGKQAAVSRRLEQFVKERQASSVGWALKALYCVCVLGCLSTALYTYFTHAVFLREKASSYLLLNQALNMANHQAAINIFVAKIWNINTNNYLSNNYSAYYPMLNRHVIDLKNTYSQLTTSLSSETYPLEYNQHNYYNFSFSDGVNGTLVQVIRLTSYADAMSNYITAATIFTDRFIANQSSTQRAILQIEALFVQKNGEELLPSIAISAMNKYYAYFSESMKDELTRIIIVKALLMVVIVACFICILLLGHYIDRVNLMVVQAYSNVRLADLLEVVSKCNKFVGQRGIKVLTKQRTSSLLKMPTAKHAAKQASISNFPITISQPRQSIQPREQAEVLTTEQPLILQTQTGEERFLNAISDQQAEPEIAVEGQEALLRGEEQQPTVKIEEERSNVRIVIALVIFFFVFGVVIFLSYREISSDSDTLQEYMHRLKVIGEVRKALNLIDYYAYRVTLNNNDLRAKGLLVGEINRFFQLTEDGYVYLGDPQPILKDTYSIIETIQQCLTVPNITTQGILSLNYSFLDDGLQHISDEISDLDSSTFFPQFKEEISFANIVELIFTLLLIGFMCVAVMALHTLYLGPIQIQGKHSLNMLRIMPAVLLQRNPKALRVIASVG